MQPSFSSISFRDHASPEGYPLPLQALWHDARGDWSLAHDVAQQANNAEGDWVHAYLHRKEGDLGNAQYWYRRAGRAVPDDSLEDEWNRIATELLARHEPGGS